jgi:hypothetical protein
MVVTGVAALMVFIGAVLAFVGGLILQSELDWWAPRLAQVLARASAPRARRDEFLGELEEAQRQGTNGVIFTLVHLVPAGFKLRAAATWGRLRRRRVGPNRGHPIPVSLVSVHGFTGRPSENLTVMCKACHEAFSSPIAMDLAAFETATLRNNGYQCPHCHQMMTYDKDDHYFVVVEITPREDQ